MDIFWILFAFVCGLAVKQFGLPPLIGYLIAGFLLNFAGLESNDALEAIANIGITLMLFTIGLKLHLGDLIKLEVWAGTLGYTALWILIFAGIALFLGALSAPYFSDLSWQSAALLAFAFSFSSTVCVIKVLEDSGEKTTRHGRFAIAVLVMQDLIAVIFLVVAAGKIPSIWAVLLFGLLLVRPIFNKILDNSGHGELLALSGFLFALGGYELFAALGVKGDLGALAAGVLLSHHNKASELSKSLFAFKDLFLIGFFLTIGLAALPDLTMVLTAVLLTLLLPLKLLLFFGLLCYFRLRARTANLVSLVLTNYSEFGLIVMILGVQLNLLDDHWLVILALSLSISFAITCIYYHNAHKLYASAKQVLSRFERPQILPEDDFFQPKNAEILVIGTGRVGQGAYHALYNELGDRVWGMDANSERIKQQKQQGMHVFVGDAENADLWENLNVANIKLVLIAIPSIEDCRNINEQLKVAGYHGKIAAIARYEDDRNQLMSYGIDKVFDFFIEAGAGFAEESLHLIGLHKRL